MTATETRKPTIAAWKVAKMTAYYGSIEAAREAYRAVRDEILAMSRDEVIMQGDKVPFLHDNGKIAAVAACDIFYRGSCDAPMALPLIKPHRKTG